VPKKHFNEPKNESPHKTEMQQILNILESIKSTESAKNSIPKAWAIIADSFQGLKIKWGFFHGTGWTSFFFPFSLLHRGWLAVAFGFLSAVTSLGITNFLVIH